MKKLNKRNKDKNFILNKVYQININNTSSNKIIGDRMYKSLWNVTMIILIIIMWLIIGHDAFCLYFLHIPLHTTWLFKCSQYLGLIKEILK